MDKDLQSDAKNKIKLWVHRELKLDNSCVILISEVNCKEDCEDKETILLVLNDCEKATAEVYRIKKCLSEIREEDLPKFLHNNKPFEKEHLELPCSKLINNIYRDPSESNN